MQQICRSLPITCRGEQDAGVKSAGHVADAACFVGVAAGVHRAQSRPAAVAKQPPLHGQVVVSDDGEDAAAAGAGLFEIGDDLFVAGSWQRQHQHRHVLVDQRNRPVLHLAGGIALGVDVADFLELQGALKGYREHQTATEKQHVARAGVLLGDGADVGFAGEDLLHVDGETSEGTHVVEHHVVADRAAQACEPQREQMKRNELGHECFGGSDTDLGSGARVQGAGGVGAQPRNGGVDHVADAHNRQPTTLHFFERGESVGGLPRLRDSDDKGALFKDRVAVAKLAGEIDFAGDARQLLDQSAANEAGVPARTARRDQDAFDVFERVGVDAIEEDGGVVEGEPAPQRVGDGAGLLKDLLVHEVLVAIFFGHRRRPRDLFGDARDGLAILIDDAEAVVLDQPAVAVFEEHKLSRMREHGRHIRGEEHFVGANTEHQRAGEAREGDGVSDAFVDDGEGIGAVDPQERSADRAEQVGASCPLNRDQVRKDFSVCFRREHSARGLQLKAQLAVVFDDAVVYDGNVVAGVRMGVVLTGPSVGGPTRVADAGGAGAGLTRQSITQVLQPANRTANGDDAMFVDGADAGGVVAAVLEPGEPLDQHRFRETMTGVADDAAHAVLRDESC